MPLSQPDDWVAANNVGPSLANDNDPQDWVPVGTLASGPIHPQSSAVGSFARGAEGQALPWAGGLAGATAAAGAVQPILAPVAAMTGPAAPFVEGAGSLAAGFAGYWGGSSLVNKAQDWALSKMPSLARTLGQDEAQIKADESAHPYARVMGGLLPGLALLRPGAVESAIEEGAPAIQRLLANPWTARGLGAGAMGAQEVIQEKAQTGHIDPWNVAISAGAGALMNRPTRLGQGVIDVASAPERILTNIARGKPANAPPSPPEAAPEAPQPGGREMDDLATTEGQEPSVSAVSTAGEKPEIDDWLTEEGQPAPALAAPQSDLLNMADHASSLERAASDQTLQLSSAARQEMLTEAARLRGLNAPAEPPAPYQHPLATEPAADLGELALARARNPEAYQGEYQRAPEPEAPSLDPYALRDVIDARAPAPKDETLFGAIRRLGGIKPDQGGDVAKIMQGFKGKPFQRRVVNPEGRSPDDIRSALQQEGWFGPLPDQHGAAALETGSYPGDDIRDLYDLLDQEARGQPVYHPDSEVPSALAARAHADEELDHAGVLSSDSNEVAARKLAAFRASREAQEQAYGPQQAAREAVSEISPEDAQALLGYGYEEYEPGSDIGAEFEEHGSAEEGARGLDDWVPVEDQNAGGAEPSEGGAANPPAEYPAERQDLGRGISAEQTLIPGTEQSARQMAAAREATGRGRIRPTAEQREPGGLFEEPGNEPTLFQQGARGVPSPARGEPIKLTDDLIGHTIANPTPEEVRLLNDIEKVAERIVPRATVRTMRALRGGEDFRSQAGAMPEGQITGATYSNGLRRLIAVSLESPDAVGTLQHEAIHYLRGRGLISPKEWNALVRASEREGWQQEHNIDLRYPDADESLRHEEAIAEEFSKWRRAPASVPKMFRPLYERVRRFLGQIADAARRVFGKDVTANDVMNRIATGDVGRRSGARMEPNEPAMAQAQEGEGEDRRVPPRPNHVPPGSVYSPSRRMWRDATGNLYTGTSPVAARTPGDLLGPQYAEPKPLPPQPRLLKPVEGAGELRTRGVAKGVEARAIDRGLVENMGELPAYNVVRNADQERLASDIVAKNYGRAKDIAMGKVQAPNGVIPEFVFKAVEDKATKDGDVDLLRQLGTKSRLLEEGTTMGQRIAAWRGRDPLSAVDAIKSVQDARNARLKAMGVDPQKETAKFIAKASKDAAAAVKRARTQSKRPTWNTLESFVSAVTCR